MPTPTEVYALSLHDALPIFALQREGFVSATAQDAPSPLEKASPRGRGGCRSTQAVRAARSEEHTSELQSQANLVCRLLLGIEKELTEIHYNRCLHAVAGHCH